MSSKGVRRKSALKSVGRTASHKVAPSTIPSIATQLPEQSAEQVKAAKKKFEEGVISRGEAVPLGKPLPPGATHVIVGYAANGTPILKRKRFSIR